MKKHALLSGLILAFLSISSVSMATVWRVNSAPGSGANFSSIQAAHDAASNGDTLYIEASATSAGTLNSSKSLTILGTGYFLAQNPQTQAAPITSYIDYIYYSAGSEGSKVAGCTIGYIYLYSSDILITRNRITCTSYGVYNPANVGNILITNNFFDPSYIYTYALYFYSPANNILVSNNYFSGYVVTPESFYGIFTNNIFNNGFITAYNSTFKNNIMEAGTFTQTNCTFTHNIANGTQFGNQNNNQENVSMSSVFVGTGSTDGKYQLKAGSPAIGAGENGADCGMYGGPFPYKLSGMPNIPAIYYFTAPSMPSNSINVSIKAKSHN